MSETDEQMTTGLSRAWHAQREQPTSVLDGSVLASARDAAEARRGARRRTLAGAFAIAAVLALSLAFLLQRVITMSAADHEVAQDGRTATSARPAPAPPSTRTNVDARHDGDHWGSPKPVEPAVPAEPSQAGRLTAADVAAQDAGVDAAHQAQRELSLPTRDAQPTLAEALAEIDRLEAAGDHAAAAAALSRFCATHAAHPRCAAEQR